MEQEVTVLYNAQKRLRELMQIFKAIPPLAVLKGKRPWDIDWDSLTKYVYGSDEDSYMESDYLNNQ